MLKASALESTGILDFKTDVLFKRNYYLEVTTYA